MCQYLIGKESSSPGEGMETLFPSLGSCDYVTAKKPFWSNNSWLNRQAVTVWSERTFISKITIRYLQVSWNNGWEEWGRQHSSEQGQGASPSSIPACWCCFALHISSSFSSHLPCAGWTPLLEVSLPQSQVSGQKVLGAARTVCSQQPLCQVWPADPWCHSCLCSLWLQLLFLFTGLSQASHSHLSVQFLWWKPLLFGSQLWLLCHSGGLMFGNTMELFGTRISWMFLVLGHLCLVQRTPRIPHF